ncbi:hypothetical protein Tco_0710287 [Tanacetum coccineum]
MDDLDNGNLDLYERNLCYDECEKMYAEAVIVFNGKLVRLIDITVEEWLKLKYGGQSTISDEMKESVIETWLIRNPFNAGFSTWLASKFNNHVMMGCGHVEWPTCNSNDDGYCDGGDLLGIIQNEDMVYFQDYEWYDGLEDGELKDKSLMKKGEFEESRGPCSFDAEWDEFKHANHIGTNANYNLYLDISQIFNSHVGKSNEEAIKEEREPMNDYGIGNSDDHLASNNEPKHANEEEEQYNEGRWKLVRNSHKILPTCKIERFEEIKYSFGPAE